MTVISLWQEIDASRPLVLLEDYLLVHQAPHLHLHMNLTD